MEKGGIGAGGFWADTVLLVIAAAAATATAIVLFDNTLCSEVLLVFIDVPFRQTMPIGSHCRWVSPVFRAITMQTIGPISHDCYKESTSDPKYAFAVFLNKRTRFLRVSVKAKDTQWLGQDR
ncbi:MAG TPA: hypothetical protein VK789_18495 [Bryobacteraceae bacterium]|nr:hypothetical protein [Bryobacteraceae bacterium]